MDKWKRPQLGGMKVGGRAAVGPGGDTDLLVRRAGLARVLG